MIDVDIMARFILARLLTFKIVDFTVQ